MPPEPSGNPFKGTPKTGWIIGGGIAAAIGVYVWWRHKQAAAAAAAAAPGGYGAAYGYGVSPIYGYGQGGLGFPGYGGGGYGGYGGQQPITTNGQWALAVENALTQQGYNPMTVSAALGKYLTAQSCTQDQASIIQAGIAFYGDPPVSGPSGYPPGIHISGPGGGGGGSISGLSVSAKFDNVTARWNPVTGATGYSITVTTHQGSQQLGSTSTTGTSGTVGHLPQKTDIAVHVTAQPGGQSATAYTRTR